MIESQETSIDVFIRNEIAELVIVSDAFQRIGENAGVPSKTLMHLQVVLDEILSNIVKYAWNPNESHEIKIGIKVHSGIITLTFIDDGIPFDPRGHAPAQLGGVGIRPQPGGVGIHLVKQLVDEFKYMRVDGKNQVIVTKRYGAPHSPGDLQ